MLQTKIGGWIHHIQNRNEQNVFVCSCLNSNPIHIWSNYSDLTRPGPPKGSKSEGKWDPLFQGNLGEVKYYEPFGQNRQYNDVTANYVKFSKNPVSVTGDHGKKLTDYWIEVFDRRKFLGTAD